MNLDSDDGSQDMDGMSGSDDDDGDGSQRHGHRRMPSTGPTSPPPPEKQKGGRQRAGRPAAAAASGPSEFQELSAMSIATPEKLLMAKRALRHTIESKLDGFKVTCL